MENKQFENKGANTTKEKQHISTLLPKYATNTAKNYV